MRVVLDTSAALNLVRRAQGWELIQKFIEQADWIESPDLFISEATNFIWKYFKAGHLSMAAAEEALEQSIEIPDEIVPCRSLYREAFALAAAGQRPAYDMFFLALARRNNSVLVSMDKGLLAFAANHDVKTFTPD